MNYLSSITLPKGIKITPLLATFLYPYGFTGTFARSFRQAVKDGNNTFLLEEKDFFPELQYLNETQKKIATKYVFYEHETFKLLFEGTYVTFDKAWEHVTRQYEDNIIKALLFSPYQTTVIMQENGKIYVYSLLTLLNEIHKGHHPQLQNYYQMELILLHGK